MTAHLRADPRDTRGLDAQFASDTYDTITRASAEWHAVPANQQKAFEWQAEVDVKALLRLKVLELLRLHSDPEASLTAIEEYRSMQLLARAASRGERSWQAVRAKLEAK